MNHVNMNNTSKNKLSINVLVQALNVKQIP